MATQTKLAERYIGPALSEVWTRLRDERYSQMFDDIIESGALSPEAEKALAAQLDPKALANVDDLAEMLHDLEDFIELLKKRINRAVETCGKFSKLLDCLKAGIKIQMELWTLRKINGRERYFLLKKNGGSIEVENESAIPPEYFDFEPRLSKTRVREAIEAGKEVPGCKLVTDKFHLEVR